MSITAIHQLSFFPRYFLIKYPKHGARKNIRDVSVVNKHMTKARRPAYSAGYGGLPPHAFLSCVFEQHLNQNILLYAPYPGATVAHNSRSSCSHTPSKKLIQFNQVLPSKAASLNPEHVKPISEGRPTGVLGCTEAPGIWTESCFLAGCEFFASVFAQSKIEESSAIQARAGAL